jgi:cold shock CspA family protein
MMTGSVRWFDDVRAIALLARDDGGEDAFCPFGAALADGCFEKLSPDQKVEFEVFDSPEGSIAGNVRRIFDAEGRVVLAPRADAFTLRAMPWGEVDLNEAARRLRRFGEVRCTPIFVRLRAAPFELTLFDEGSAIVKGAADAAHARRLLDEWLRPARAARSPESAVPPRGAPST